MNVTARPGRLALLLALASLGPAVRAETAPAPSLATAPATLAVPTAPAGLSVPTPHGIDAADVAGVRLGVTLDAVKALFPTLEAGPVGSVQAPTQWVAQVAGNPRMQFAFTPNQILYYLVTLQSLTGAQPDPAALGRQCQAARDTIPAQLVSKYGRPTYAVTTEGYLMVWCDEGPDRVCKSRVLRAQIQCEAAQGVSLLITFQDEAIARSVASPPSAEPAPSDGGFQPRF